MKDNITVGVRVRPPLPREIQGGVSKNCVAVDPSSNQIFVSLKDQPVVLSASREVPEGVAAYKFDHCFDAGIKQDQVYEATVRPAVRAVLDGYNATVFAYG